MTNFRKYANYYDLLYRDKDYSAEACYVDEIIRRYAPGTRHLLELGCGTGGHTFQLAELGYGLHSIDASRDMLDVAHARLLAAGGDTNGTITFRQGDIRNYRLDRKFDAVISLFHVVSYQTSNEDLIATFRTAAHHLNRGGIFVFDCWYGPAVLSEKPVNREKSAEDERLLIERTTTPQLWPDNNIVDVNFDIRVTNKTSGSREHFRELHRMRYLFSPETAYYLQVSGLVLESAEEWLTGNVPDTATWNVCYIARA
jgi:SAM-dependent methyltransferase